MMKIEEVQQFMKDNMICSDGVKFNARKSEKWLEENHPEVLDSILKYSEKIIKFKNKLKLIYDHNGSMVCDVCGVNEIKENKFRYNKFLCDGCFSEDVRVRTEATNMKKYGGKAPASSDDIKNKIKNTVIERYGVEHHSKLKSTQDKKVKTNLKRYGVRQVSQLEENKKHLSEVKKQAYEEKLPSESKYFLDNIEETYEIYTKRNLSILELASITGIDATTLTRRFVENGYNIYRKSVSSIENELYNYLVKEFPDINIVQSDRTAIKPKEIDIYFPDLKLGIEVNGWYWHSIDTKQINKNHMIKYKMAKENGIQLLQFWDHELDLKKDIVRSIINIKLKRPARRIYARKCIVSEIDNATYSDFCENNHLQGYGIAKYRYGLFHEGELISVMSFSTSRYTKGVDFEMVRFCNKLNTMVVGGASKIFKHFLKLFNNPSVVSYADARISNGNLYETLGFNFERHSNPNYFYIKKYGVLESRVKYQKHKLKNILDVYDENLSEKDNMINNGYRILYDAGNLVYIHY